MQQNFLNKAAAEVLKRFPTNLHEQLLVFPNKRAVGFFVEYLKKEYPQTQWLPKFLSVAEFFEHWSGLSIANGLQTKLYLYEAYAKIKGNDKKKIAYQEFEQWSANVLSDFNEIDQYLLPTGPFFRDLNRDYALRNWFPDENHQELTNQQQQFLNFWKELEPLYLSLQQLMLNDGLLYSGALYRYVAEQVTDKQSPFLNSFDKAIFIGLNALSKAEEKSLLHLKEREKALFFWDVDERWSELGIEEANFFVAKHMRALGSDFQLSKFSSWPSIQVIETNSKHEQFAALTKKADEGYFTEAESSAIVMADEQALIPLLHSLPSSLKQVNVSSGYPLSQTEILRFCSHLLRFLQTATENKVRAEKLNMLLSFGFIPWDAEKAGNEQAESFISFTQLQKTGNTFLLDLINDFKQNNIAGFSDAFLLCLQSIKSHLTDIASPEKEALEIIEENWAVFKRKVQRFSNLIEVEQWFTLFLQSIQKESISFIGEPFEGIQLVGLLETRNLAFEKVVLLDANEGNLPATVAYQSYIPLELRHTYSLPGKKEKEKVFAHYFFRLLSSCHEICIVSSSSEGGLKSGEKSRYIELLKLASSALQPRENAVSAPVFTVTKPKALKSSKDISERVLETILEHGLSPSTLGKFFTNPFEFYLKMAAKVRESEQKQAITPATLGSYVHKGLEEGVKTAMNKQLNSQDWEMIEKAALKQVLEDFTADFGANFLQNGEKLMYHSIAVDMVKTYCQYEAKSKECFVIIGNESELKRSLIVGGEEIKITGKIDRVDQLSNGIRIADYKTGRIENKDISIKSFQDLFEEMKAEPKEKFLQLMIYQWLYYPNLKEGQSLQATLIGLKARTDRYFYAKEDKSIVEYNKEIDEQLTTFLKHTVKQMLDESYAFEIVLDERKSNLFLA